MNAFTRTLALALAVSALTISTVSAQLTGVESLAPQPPEPLSPQNGTTYNGYVQQQVFTQPATPGPQSASEYLGITVTPAKLREYSDRKYQAVTITLENKQPVHVELLQGEVLNALDEAKLAYEKQQAKARGRKIGGALLGLASAVPGVAYMGATSYGAHMALNATSSALGTTRYVVENLPDGGQGITGQYVARVGNVVLSPRQTFTFEALLPKDANPQVKVVFKDLQTNRIFDMAQ